MTFVSAFQPGLLSGKVAFVAGASSGINLAIAQTLAAAGAKLGIISRTEERIKAAEKTIVDRGGEAIGIVADVRDYNAVDNALRIVRDAYGEIDIVVSGAAGNFTVPVLGMSSNAFQTVVNIDLIGTFHVYRACFAYLRKPGASLISITANQAVSPVMFQAHAGAAKAGVNALTKSLALEWGPAGIRVNAIAPGPIADTAGVALGSSAQADQVARASRLPLRRFGKKQDIAEAALFLCSDSASYVTGIVLNCDGGYALGDATEDALTVTPR